MKYEISYQNPSTQYIDIKVNIVIQKEEELIVHLPAWRPGRYELGDFAKNIQKWQVFDTNGKAVASKKLSKDSWLVQSKGLKEVAIHYNYYAADLNAGSTYLSDHQLYVNPVNCLLYVREKMGEKCVLKLNIPDDYKVATSLESIGKNEFQAKDFDELVDSPIIASNSMKHHQFKVDKTIFHLWFQGEFKSDWKRLEKDFKDYTKEQIKLFGEFPVEVYHYLFQILPNSAYHGVEHAASTVIALGPAYNILKKEGRYLDLLGVSSHELFHTWNVKRIRPEEMWPYDFSKENYNRLGYLSEGATTWYGDLMLFRSDVFNDIEYFKTFNQLLDRHFNNPGVLNLSVADSSFDTWLDGYQMGVPNRKSSIYVEGALVTFILDIAIRKATKNKKSFDNVLQIFYEEYYKKGQGISEQNYKSTAEKVAGIELDEIFNAYINGHKDFTDALKEGFDYLGIQWTKSPSDLQHEAYLGIRLKSNEVAMVYPNSVAEQSGISVGDHIQSIAGYQIKDNLSDWLDYFHNDQINMALSDRYGNHKEVSFQLSEQYYFGKNELSKIKKPSKEQEKNFKLWKTTN